MSNTITIEDYTALLNAHDWCYARSELMDRREQGQRQRRYLIELAFNREDFLKLFFEYLEEHIGA